MLFNCLAASKEKGVLKYILFFFSTYFFNFFSFSKVIRFFFITSYIEDFALVGFIFFASGIISLSQM